MKNIILLVLFLVFATSFCVAQKQLGSQIIGELPTTISVNSDNFALTINSRTYIRIGSNSNTANQRTLILGRGLVVGQICYIEFVGVNTCEIIDDSALTGGGNLRLSGVFNMNNFDLLALLWNGTDWVQLYRSVN